MSFNCADFYDAELKRHNAHLRAAGKVDDHDCVLDIGCGAGQTTREAARLAVRGSVLGIDVSTPMLEIARQRSADEGLGNVRFELGDAENHAFSSASFDLCISRFGVMFFADPAAAFTNIGKAMRPGARLVWMVWQSQNSNPWSFEIRQALVPKSQISAQASTAFSLGDPDGTRDLLRGAGFTSIDFTDVREPVFYGANVDAAHDALIGLQFMSSRSAPSDAQLRLHDMLRAHLTPEGVLFDSRAWIITARCAYG
jgi:ubiquinone/menaquinone biosynthesis C-methylase UbiE